MPPSADDVTHKVRLVAGKGLRGSQSWARFKLRFKVDRIGEYYGSVDSGNYNMVNSYNKAGAVGFFPWFAFPLYQINLISYDPKTGEEVRDKDGLCVSSEHGKPGILLDKLPDDFGKTKFSKNKKVIKDVFKKGDAYINTGDILVKDERGYFYLVDTVAGIKRKNGQNEYSDSSSQLQDINLKSETQRNNEPREHVVQIQKEVSKESDKQLDYQPVDEEER